MRPRAHFRQPMFRIEKFPRLSAERRVAQMRKWVFRCLWLYQLDRSSFRCPDCSTSETHGKSVKWPSPVILCVSLPFASHLPAAQLGGAPFKSCPELSKLSLSIRPPSAFPSAKRFSLLSCSHPSRHPFNVREAVSCFSMSSLPLSRPFKSAKRHSIHSCRFPSALLPRPSRNP